MNTDTEYISIKELAKLAGVSTQSIYKQLPTKLQTYTTKVANKTMLKKTVLQEVYHIENCNQVTNQVEEVTNQNATDTVKLLQDTLDTLKQQLEQKDKQIEELTKSLQFEQGKSKELADKLFLLEDKKQEESIEVENPAADEKKIHWWQKWF